MKYNASSIPLSKAFFPSLVPNTLLKSPLLIISIKSKSASVTLSPLANLIRFILLSSLSNPPMKAARLNMLSDNVFNTFKFLPTPVVRLRNLLGGFLPFIPTPVKSSKSASCLYNFLACVWNPIANIVSTAIALSLFIMPYATAKLSFK